MHFKKAVKDDNWRNQSVTSKLHNKLRSRIILELARFFKFSTRHTVYNKINYNIKSEIL
jgi:hypothetical protein